MMKAEVQEEMVEVKLRSFSKRIELGLMAVAAATSLIYLYTAWWGILPPLKQRAILLLVCLVFAFLYYPMRRRSPWGLTFLLDCGLALLSTGTLIYVMVNEFRIAYQMTVASPLDLTVAVLFLFLILEATRRVVGWSLVIMPLILIVYAIFGPYMPGRLLHAGIDWDFLVTIGAFSTSGGVFGIALDVATTVVIMFLLFSSFLRESGAEFFFIDLPYALLGWMRGGPAKLAIVASGLFGMLSGSGPANVVATGTFTIPLMKRTGYKPEMAGAIEAMSSTGGQFMPPVMGAAAFIMAEFLNQSYWSICVAAFIPATLYYISLFAVVDLEAAKTGLKGVPRKDLPSISKTLKSGWFLLAPLVALVLLLVARWQPMKACFVAILLTVVVSQFSKRTRMGPRKIFNALAAGVKDALMVTVICASAGIVIYVVNMTGLGMRMSAWLIELSGGHLIILLILCALVAIILGMGMTTAAIYIFLALLIGPALVKMGVVPVAAHLFIFYYGCLCGITPPVCIAVFVASAIAKSKPMATGFLAWRLALVGFIVPFFFVYQRELILQGEPGAVIWAVFTAIIGTIAFAVMLQRYLLTRTTLLETVLFGTGGLFLMYPGLYTDAIGFLELIIALALHVARRRRTGLPFSGVAEVDSFAAN